MQRLFILIVSILLFSCSNSQEKIDSTIQVETIQLVEPIKIDSIPQGLNLKPGTHYSKTRATNKSHRIKLSKLYLHERDTLLKNQLLDSFSHIFDSLLLNTIIPYWYGTEWDFNGHTSIPNQGKIACGYFVSTTLRDMDVNLNRYDLAKKGPEDEAKSIAISDNYTAAISADSIKSKLFNMNNGLYFIGLDNHVGYLYKSNDVTYFIHSNYMVNKVMIELTSTSVAFESSTYYISSISGNKDLIKSWLLRTKIKVVGD